MGVLDRFRLNGKVALVTGGARGLGKAFAEALAQAGANVVVTARDIEHAGVAAEKLREQEGVQALGVRVDVTKAAEVNDMVAQTLDTFGRLDIVVNNAGINIRGPIDKLTEQDFDDVIATNLKGPWLVCRAAAEPMKRQKWGRVINVSSMLGEVALAERTPYCASKGGLTMMTKSLALEWAKEGITVNALCPGFFATEINKVLLEDPVTRAAFVAKVPMGRWGEPEEMGATLVYLASDASSYMTGAVILFDGGCTAQ